MVAAAVVGAAVVVVAAKLPSSPPPGVPPPRDAAREWFDRAVVRRYDALTFYKSAGLLPVYM